MHEFPGLLPPGMECSLPSTNVPNHTKAHVLGLCYGLSCVFQKLDVEVLTPKNVTLFGE